MDEANSAHSAATLRHFAAEGLRSDMKSPPVWSIHRGSGRVLDLPNQPRAEPAQVYAPMRSLMQSCFTGKICRTTQTRAAAAHFRVSCTSVTA